jgi:methionyl-tRNA formyltransferase
VKNGYEVVGVVTVADKMGGRGMKQVLESPVKKYAVAQGIPVLQPDKLRDPEFLAQLRSLGANLQIVVAFRMLPKVVWNMPELGTFNLHGSLLPRYRGAAPINWAVINGDAETGVTTFFLQHEIDTGNIIFQETLPIGPDETAGDIHDRMMLLGADTVLKTVQAIETASAPDTPQDDTQASHAPKIFHETCKINFNQSAEKVHNFIRGLSPHPVAWTVFDGEKIKIYKTKKISQDTNFPAGTIETDGKKYLSITCSEGCVEILELQPDKRKRMDIKSFLNGTLIKSESVEM